ncbi:MAG: TSUP family transporter [Paenibacillaceae bacterium]
MEFEWIQIVIALIASVLIGFSKAGFPSAGIFVIVLMASIFPTKESTGIVLPMLITADIIAVIYYRKTVIWKHLISLIPWVLIGIVLGFTTMVGNAAGAIMAIYLFSKGSNKQDFIGTNAWFFLSVNLIKVPFSVGLGLITPQSLWFNSWMVPTIVVGAFLGIRILPLIPQKYFQLIILMFAALGGIRLIFW